MNYLNDGKLDDLLQVNLGTLLQNIIMLFGIN